MQIRQTLQADENGNVTWTSPPLFEQGAYNFILEGQESGWTVIGTVVVQ
jgi:hypothetical protein